MYVHSRAVLERLTVLGIFWGRGSRGVERAGFLYNNSDDLELKKQTKKLPLSCVLIFADNSQ